VAVGTVEAAVVERVVAGEEGGALWTHPTTRVAQTVSRTSGGLRRTNRTKFNTLKDHLGLFQLTWYGSWDDAQHGRVPRWAGECEWRQSCTRVGRPGVARFAHCVQSVFHGFVGASQGREGSQPGLGAVAGSQCVASAGSQCVSVCGPQCVASAGSQRGALAGAQRSEFTNVRNEGSLGGR
jgi:hypothetical protein